MGDKPTGGGGGGGRGGTQRTNAVDADRLWIDRINQELIYQRSWVAEYGFMVDEEKRQTLMKGIARGAVGGGGASSGGSPASGGPGPDQPAQQGGHNDHKSGMTYGGLKSTSMASYTQRGTPELFDTRSFNRRRFKYD